MSEFKRASELKRESEFERLVDTLRTQLAERKFSDALRTVKTYLAERGYYVTRISVLEVKEDSVTVYTKDLAVVITKELIYIKA
ncbi:MAG: hypothetical protein ABWK05_07150 [Pyrobaculum sp.]